MAKSAWVPATVVLLLGLTATFPTPGFSQSSTKVGVLTCHTSVRFGLVLASRQRLRCEFTPDRGGKPEHYAGRVIHAGHDLSFSAQGVMTWAVLAPESDLPRGALIGSYWRAGGSAAQWRGKALVSRSHRSVLLEPLATTDVNLASGIDGFSLRPLS